MSITPGGPAEFGHAVPLVAGDVLGLRIWTVVLRSAGYTVDPDGETIAVPERVGLKSVYRDYFWHPGINVATCLIPRQASTGYPPILRLPTEECKERHEHGPDNPLRPDTCYREHLAEGIDPMHSCGFYAYTLTENNRYLVGSSVQIEGLVQGFGMCTIGPKGFRASKAAVLALVVPPEVKPTTAAAKAVAERFDPQTMADLFGVQLFDTRERLLEEFALGARHAAWTF